MNDIVFVVDDIVDPLTVTDHDVPDESPVSLNVTVYLDTILACVNVMFCVTFFPLTTMFPDKTDDV